MKPYFSNSNVVSQWFQCTKMSSKKAIDIGKAFTTLVTYLSKTFDWLDRELHVTKLNG